MNVKDKNYVLLQCMSAELAYCTYLLRNNVQIIDEAESSDADAGNFDLCVISERNSCQNRDVLLVQRNRLIQQINECLKTIPHTAIQLLVADKDYPWCIELVGDEQNPEFSLDFVKGRYLVDHLDTDKVCSMLFFPQIDFGDIPNMNINNLTGEFWQISGNVSLGRALWPFRIDYDGNCICLDVHGNIMICDNIEK